jgi:hypothetical protein
MKTNKIHLGFLFVILGTFLVACGGLVPTTRPTATLMTLTYPTAEYTNQRLVVKGAGGKMEMGNYGTLPDELPRDVPIYYPGSPTYWTIDYSGIAPFFTIQIEAGGDQTSVLDWYKSNLLTNSWVIGPLDVNLGSQSCGEKKPETIEAKKDTRILQVSICATSCSEYCKTDIVLFYTENH